MQVVIVELEAGRQQRPGWQQLGREVDGRLPTTVTTRREGGIDLTPLRWIVVAPLVGCLDDGLRFDAVSEHEEESEESESRHDRHGELRARAGHKREWCGNSRVATAETFKQLDRPSG